MEHDTRSHLTKAHIHLDHLTHNMKLLQSLAGNRPMWPAIKANAYGHGADIIARHLVQLGYETLCVAHAPEAMELISKGIKATFMVLSATLPEGCSSFTTTKNYYNFSRFYRKQAYFTRFRLKLNFLRSNSLYNVKILKDFGYFPG
jgi:alanine racemase